MSGIHRKLSAFNSGKANHCWSRYGENKLALEVMVHIRAIWQMPTEATVTLKVGEGMGSNKCEVRLVGLGNCVATPVKNKTTTTKNEGLVWWHSWLIQWICPRFCSSYSTSDAAICIWPGKLVEDGPSSWVPAPRGRPGGNSWIWIVSTLAVMSVWRVNQWVEEISLCFSLSLSICLSFQNK